MAITTIDFLIHRGKGHYEYRPIACGYCSTPPKEVLQELAPKFHIASYHNRILCPSKPYLWFESIAIYDVDNKRFDAREELEKFFDKGWEIIKPKISGVRIKPSPTLDHLLKKVEKEIGQEQYDDFFIIPPFRKNKMEGEYGDVPSDAEVEAMIKADKKTFAFEKIAKDYMKTIVNRVKRFVKSSNEYNRKVCLSAATANILLADEPIREMCEVFLRKEDLTQDKLMKAIKKVIN